MRVSQLKKGMVILEVDSYGNNLFEVISDPYVEGICDCVKVRFVDTKEEIQIGESYGYSLELVLIKGV